MYAFRIVHTALVLCHFQSAVSFRLWQTTLTWGLQQPTEAASKRALRLAARDLAGSGPTSPKRIWNLQPKTSSAGAIPTEACAPAQGWHAHIEVWRFRALVQTCGLVRSTSQWHKHQKACNTATPRHLPRMARVRGA